MTDPESVGRYQMTIYYLLWLVLWLFATHKTFT